MKIMRTKKLIIAMIASTLAMSAFASKSSLSAPVFVQKIKIDGIVDISPNYPVTANCYSCTQTVKANNNEFYIYYDLPSDQPVIGTMTYTYLTGDYDKPPLCGYNATIPFVIDKSGNLSVKNGTYDAPMNPLSDHGCEKHAITSADTEGDTIYLKNTVL